MIAAFLLAQVAGTAVPPPAAPETDIVVVGQRLKKWTGRISTTFGITSCRTTVSTGDKEIDVVGCTALRDCWSTYRPRLQAANDAGRPADERRVAGDAVRTEFGQCLKTKRDDLVAALVERRLAAR